MLKYSAIYQQFNTLVGQTLSSINYSSVPTIGVTTKPRNHNNNYNHHFMNTKILEHVGLQHIPHLCIEQLYGQRPLFTFITKIATSYTNVSSPDHFICFTFSHRRKSFFHLFSNTTTLCLMAWSSSSTILHGVFM